VASVSIVPRTSRPALRRLRRGEIAREPQLAQVERGVAHALDEGLAPGDLPRRAGAPELGGGRDLLVEVGGRQRGQRGAEFGREGADAGDQRRAVRSGGGQLGGAVAGDRPAAAEAEGVATARTGEPSAPSSLSGSAMNRQRGAPI
jgi:hypothetical protein